MIEKINRIKLKKNTVFYLKKTNKIIIIKIIKKKDESLNKNTRQF